VRCSGISLFRDGAASADEGPCGKEGFGGDEGFGGEAAAQCDAAELDIPSLLSAYFPEHGPYLGVYAQVDRAGCVREGSGVFLLAGVYLPSCPSISLLSPRGQRPLFPADEAPSLQAPPITPALREAAKLLTRVKLSAIQLAGIMTGRMQPAAMLGLPLLVLHAYQAAGGVGALGASLNEVWLGLSLAVAGVATWTFASAAAAALEHATN
jgi:hypothetical protein